VVHSKYHGDDHCLCPAGKRCVGSLCSTGQSMNGNIYHHSVHGFSVACHDCDCINAPEVADFSEIRKRGELWIIGTHHKTGSFLAMRLWGGLHTLVDPSLKVKVSQFRPMSQKQWSGLDPKVDVLVTFHSQNISSQLLQVTGRPYKLIHIVRDPVESIVSAFLYEKQRIGEAVHDNFHKLVKAKIKISEEVALLAMVDAMMPSLVDMENQFLLAAQDHRALNIKLEDFSVDFNDTVLRMFRFLEVPAPLLPYFVEAAQREDLSQKNRNFINGSSHVTTGKYDTRPMQEKVFNLPKYTEVFKRMKQTMGYACCP
jgi:hypothetical protein